MENSLTYSSCCTETPPERAFADLRCILYVQSSLWESA